METVVARAAISRKVGIPRSTDCCFREIWASSWASFSSAWVRLLCSPSISPSPAFPFGFQDAREEVVADFDKPGTFCHVDDQGRASDTSFSEPVTMVR